MTFLASLPGSLQTIAFSLTSQVFMTFARWAFLQNGHNDLIWRGLSELGQHSDFRLMARRNA